MRYVALLRGVNVGRHTQVAMSDVRELLSQLGHTEVSTYLRSGNALFTSGRGDPTELAREIEQRSARDLGCALTALVRTQDELAAVVAGNPFPDAAADPTRLHVAFLSAYPDGERLAEIDPRQVEPDEFRAGDRVIYLRYPNGVTGARLTVGAIERRLGVITTTRNWNTVTKLLALADG